MSEVKHLYSWPCRDCLASTAVTALVGAVLSHKDDNNERLNPKNGPRKTRTGMRAFDEVPIAILKTAKTPNPASHVSRPDLTGYGESIERACREDWERKRTQMQWVREQDDLRDSSAERHLPSTVTLECHGFGAA